MDQPKIERMLRLMRLLASNTNYTIDELAEKLNMSCRAIYRYIDTFKSSGHVISKRHTITRAICRQTDGSRTDGKKLFQLPFPVMRFDVNFPAISHSVIASDADWFTELFLTDYCKALSRAFYCKVNFHKNETLDLESESKERLLIEYSIRLDKDRTFTQNEINVLLYKKHESLPPLDSNTPYKCKYI